MKYSAFVIGFAAFVLMSVCAFSNNELERLDNSIFENPKRPGAVFSHDDHNETAEIEECWVCHHVYEEKQLVEEESSEDSLCADCHSLKKNDENSISLRVAYHKRCKDCHFEANKGPVLCGECHIKQ